MEVHIFSEIFVCKAVYLFALVTAEANEVPVPIIDMEVIIHTKISSS